MAALHVFILYSYTGTRNFFWFQRVRKNARKQKSLFYFINIENPSNDNIIRGGKKIKFTACPKPRRHFNKPQKFFDEQNWFHSSSVVPIPQKTSLARQVS